jgi:hypothetical protein
VNQGGSATCANVHAYSGQGGNGSLTAAVSVPAGNWVVIGEETIQPQNSGGTDLTCNIDVNGNSLGHASQFAPQNHDANVTPVALATITSASGTAIQLVCDTNLNPILTPGASIVAIPRRSRELTAPARKFAHAFGEPASATVGSMRRA